MYLTGSRTGICYWVSCNCPSIIYGASRIVVDGAAVSKGARKRTEQYVNGIIIVDGTITVVGKCSVTYESSTIH